MADIFTALALLMTLRISVVRLATSSDSPPLAATHLPLKGKARGKAVLPPADFYCGQYFR